MNRKSITGALLILASTVLFSASLISSAVSDLATAQLGFISASEPTSVMVLTYAMSAILAIAGSVLIFWDMRQKH